jgi:hypothetical protein
MSIYCETHKRGGLQIPVTCFCRARKTKGLGEKLPAAGGKTHQFWPCPLAAGSGLFKKSQTTSSREFLWLRKAQILHCINRKEIDLESGKRWAKNLFEEWTAFLVSESAKGDMILRLEITAVPP